MPKHVNDTKRREALGSLAVLCHFQIGGDMYSGAKLVMAALANGVIPP
jgi:hypothetical protein